MPAKRKPAKAPAKTAKKPALVSKAEYARLSNVTRASVTRWARAGIIPVTANGKIDPEKADAARRKNIDPAQVAGGRAKLPDKKEKKAKPGKPRNKRTSEDADSEAADSETHGSYSDMRTRRERLKLEREELELAKAKEEVVSRDLAKRVVREAATVQAKHWQQWPAAVYAEIAAELGVDGALVHRVLDEKVRAHLRELSEAKVSAKL